MKTACSGILALLLLASCSSYPGEYRTSATKFKNAKVSPTTPIGPWEGVWKSEVNGHHGPLWCLVSQDPKKPGIWNFRYRAGWGIINFGDYTHSIKAKADKDGKITLNDKMTLPNDFGTYKVAGTVTPKDFKVRFNGNGDKGTMTLTRPPIPLKEKE